MTGNETDFMETPLGWAVVALAFFLLFRGIILEWWPESRLARRLSFGERGREKGGGDHPFECGDGDGGD